MNGTWTAVPLGDICTFRNGGTPKRNIPEYFGGEIPWLTGADINGPVAGECRTYLTESGIDASAGCIVPEGTVLLVTRTGVGKVAVADRSLSFSQDITALIPNPERVRTDYLMHFLQTQVEKFKSESRGATIKGITRKVVASTMIPLPPVRDQKRISSILQLADGLYDQRLATLRSMTELESAFFFKQFGDPSLDKCNWPLVRLRDILEIPLRNGVSPSNSGSTIERVLVLSAVTGEVFRPEAWKRGTFVVAPPTSRRVNANDFLICRGNGNLNLVGRGHFPLQSLPDVVFPDTMIAARISPSRMSPRFLEHVWNTRIVRNQIESVARTTNGTFKVNQEMLEAVRLPDPPWNVQQEFDRNVNSLWALRDRSNSTLRQLEELRLVLQRLAFQGTCEFV